MLHHGHLVARLSFLYVFCLHVYIRSTHMPMSGCEPLCGCYELNSGPVQEQQVLLNVTEPTLQALDEQ